METFVNFRKEDAEDDIWSSKRVGLAARIRAKIKTYMRYLNELEELSRIPDPHLSD